MLKISRVKGADVTGESIMSGVRQQVPVLLSYQIQGSYYAYAWNRKACGADGKTRKSLFKLRTEDIWMEGLCIFSGK